MKQATTKPQIDRKSIMAQARDAWNSNTRQRQQRSRITTKGRLPGVDGQSTWARRRKDLIEALTIQWKPDTILEHALIANAADAQVRSEQLAVDVSNGKEISHYQDEEKTRMANLIVRTQQYFADRQRKQADKPDNDKAAPDLHDHVRRKLGAH
jgi:hypothetical protein